MEDQVSLMTQRELERWDLFGIIGQSRTLRTVLEDIRRLQQASTSVLISGESGTGKELIARAIHAGNGRSREPFIPVNCAAIPENLAESLLFGHRRGAFSGAVQDQSGYFAFADGGTLFLDEISDMPLPIQAKLLRVFESGNVLPLGAREESAVDVRVPASSNQNLDTNIKQGRFRADLYYRLAAYSFAISPLWERQEDIPLLARYFLNLFAKEMNRPLPTLTPDAMERLCCYAFPGNVRELKNLMEGALLMCTGSDILPEHLQIGTAIIPPDVTFSNTLDNSPSAIDFPFNLAQAEVALVRRTLDQTGGNVAAAARLLGIARNKVYRVLGK